jgi:hypothetical protein
MTTKTTGAQWKRFYRDEAAWPKGAWHDDEEMTVDGKPAGDVDPMSFADTAVITIAGGIVYLKEADQDGPSLEAHFKKWRKAQNSVSLLVDVERADESAVRMALADLRRTGLRLRVK